MSAIYYRRWTRMYAQPAFKYFHRYGVLNPGYEIALHQMNHENPVGENKRFNRRLSRNHEEDLNNQLIEKLFLKYPDLKYESISRARLGGDNFNSYSYAQAFITEQKKLIKAGYSAKKAFGLVEAKFQERMKRKIDQTILSKGLAIGNRARSFLTLYQQQVEYESRLKMVRTQRQVLKYESRLKEIEEQIHRPSDISQSEEYERVFSKITQLSEEEINANYSREKRDELVTRVGDKFSSMFSQFYERAGYVDRLRGLTDEEIRDQIMTSPQKIKRQSRQLIKYLRSKGNVSLNSHGDLVLGDSIPEKLRNFIYSSPTVKIALLNELLGYESPNHSIKKSKIDEAKMKLSALSGFKGALTAGQRENILENKKKAFELLIQKDIPADSRAYTIFQSPEERMLRLEIKYYQSFFDKEDPDFDVMQNLKNTIEKFRRLKFRMEKRHQKSAAHELAFPEHFALGETNNIEQDAEYEELLDYLRKKMEERRLKAMDQVDDNKINQLIRDAAVPEIARGEGQTKL